MANSKALISGVIVFRSRELSDDSSYLDWPQNGPFYLTGLIGAPVPISSAGGYRSTLLKTVLGEAIIRFNGNAAEYLKNNGAGLAESE
jgi:hypothetical protein